LRGLAGTPFACLHSSHSLYVNLPSLYLSFQEEKAAELKAEKKARKAAKKAAEAEKVLRKAERATLRALEAKAAARHNALVKKRDR
jgi:hypothetical protein